MAINKGHCMNFRWNVMARKHKMHLIPGKQMLTVSITSSFWIRGYSLTAANFIHGITLYFNRI
jgi:hypothetical protein